MISFIEIVNKNMRNSEIQCEEDTNLTNQRGKHCDVWMRSGIKLDKISHV